MKPDTDFLLKIPQEQGTGRALSLAVLMHVLLMLVLWYGMYWQNNPSSGVEVELWSEMPNEPATVAQPAVAEPSPAVARPTARIFSMPPIEQADISLRQRNKQPPQPLPPTEGKTAAQSPAQSTSTKAEMQRERQALLARQTAKKQVNQQPKREQQFVRERLMQEMKTFEAQRVKEHAEKKREDRLSRLQQMANASAQTSRATLPTTGKTTGQMGAHAGSGGEAGAGYADKVRQRVRPNIVFDADSVAGNPQAVVEVDCAPDGSILSVRLSRSSGNPLWDSAVLRAVEKSDPMPRGEGQQTPGHFMITFQPKN